MDGLLICSIIGQIKPGQSLSIVLGDAALHYVRARIISDWRRLWLLSITIVISSGQVEAVLEYNDQCELHLPLYLRIEVCIRCPC